MLLEVDHVSVSYGPIRAIEDVSLQVPEGGVVAAIGANGAGKSTLVRAILGLAPIRAGEIRFDGARIDRRRTASIVSGGIALSPEGRRVFPEMTVEDNLLTGAFTQSDRASIRESRDLVFEYFPVLEERIRQLAGTLSGGEQQMLALGRALMARPRLILLDEPSLGLAPKVIADVGRLIGQLNQDQGIGILIAEQNAQLALWLADHAYIMQTGSVLREGPADEMMQDDELRRAYMGA